MTLTLATLDAWGFDAARYLLAALWQSSIVFAVVAALSVVLRRYTPGARRALWLAALLVAPALPLLSNLAKPSGLPQQAVVTFPAYEPIVTPEVEFKAEPTSSLTHDIVAPLLSAPTPLDYPWAMALVLYGIGAGAFLAWTALGHIRIRQWMQSGVAVTEPALLDAFVRAADRLGIWRPARVVLTDRVPAPLTAGLLRPTVLLPIDIASALAPNDLYAVALHETVHIKQREPLILTLASLVRCVLFFHPLVWLACRRLATLAEHGADDAVLAITGVPADYAKLLTTFAERLPLRTPATEGAAGLVFCKSAFLKRVEAILGDRNRIRKLTRLALAGTVAAVLVSLAGALALPLGTKAQVGALPSRDGNEHTPDVSELVDASSSSSLNRVEDHPTVNQQSTRDPEGEPRSVQQKIDVLERQRLAIRAKLDEAVSSFRSTPKYVQDERESLERQLQLAEKDFKRISQMASNGLAGQGDVEQSEMALQQLREKTAATRLARENEKNASRLLILKHLDDIDADLAALRSRKEQLGNHSDERRPSGPSEVSADENVLREIQLRIKEEKARCKVISEKIEAASALAQLMAPNIAQEQTALERQLQLAESDLERTQRMFDAGLEPKLEADKKELVIQRLREKIAATTFARKEDSSEAAYYLRTLLNQAQTNLARLKAEQAEIDKRMAKDGESGEGKGQRSLSKATEKTEKSAPYRENAVPPGAGSSTPSSGLDGRFQIRWIIGPGEGGPADEFPMRVTVGSKAEIVRVQKDVLVDDSDVISAETRTRPGSNRVNVAVTFTDAAGKRLKAATQAHHGEKLATIVNGEIISAPTVMGVIGANAEISGLLPDEVKQFAAKLNERARARDQGKESESTKAAVEKPSVAEHIDPVRVKPNTVAGAVVLDRELVLPPEMWEKKPLAERPRLVFTPENDTLRATIHFKYPSAPRTRWRVQLLLADEKNNPVFTDTKTFENSGTIMRVADAEECDVTFTVPSDKKDSARQFLVTTASVWTEYGNPLRFDEDIPLELSLDAPEFTAMIWTAGLRVARTDKGAAATIHTAYLPSPKTSWRVSVHLTDADGKDVAAGTSSFENDGSPVIYVGFAFRQSHDLVVPLTGDPTTLERAKRFTVTLEKADAALPAMPIENTPRSSLNDTAVKLRVTDGTRPVGDADVVLATPKGQQIWVNDGKVSGSDYGDDPKRKPIVTRTGADGQCELPALNDACVVVVTHPSGYAIYNREQILSNDNTITLKPWAVVEGRARLKSTPGGNVAFGVSESLMFDKNGDAARAPSDDGIGIGFRCQFKTDTEGRFKIDRMPGASMFISYESPRDPRAPVQAQIEIADGWFCLEHGAEERYHVQHPNSSSLYDPPVSGEYPVQFPIVVDLKEPESNPSSVPKPPTEPNASTSRSGSEAAQSAIERALAKKVSLKMAHPHVINVAEELASPTGANIFVNASVVAMPDGSKTDPRHEQYISDGAVPYIDLKNVTLREALKALTRPMGLGFTVRDDAISIGPPLPATADDQKALDRRITVSWPDSTLGEAIDAIVEASDVTIVLDNESGAPRFPGSARLEDLAARRGFEPL